ncbi:MAG: hexose kinase [Peptoniphilaceae bacterium]|nr:hexose kinase [Peptoniphilaceae bacterium]MDY3738619.1 hexose kinase [Peptoniphilaceae bacterium]
MILTITANPSVDISYNLDKLNINTVNRTDDVHKDAGGKGIHVSYVLHELGEDPLNTGFIGGKLGEFIEERLNEKEVKSDFVKIDSETRNCINIIHEGNNTEILEKGPTIIQKDKDEFFNKLEKIKNKLSAITISGSLPNGLDFDFYEKIIEFSKKNKIIIGVDTSGSTLEKVINADIKPDLIKPNVEELKQVIKDDNIKSDLEVKEIFKKNPFKEIKYIIASMGKDGALFKAKDKFYRARVPKIDAVNAVGSGDSSLAGAIFALVAKKSDEEIIKTSMNCGLLNAMEIEIAHIDINKFDEYYNKIQVEEI